MCLALIKLIRKFVASFRSAPPFASPKFVPFDRRGCAPAVRGDLPLDQRTLHISEITRPQMFRESQNCEQKRRSARNRQMSVSRNSFRLAATLILLGCAFNCRVSFADECKPLSPLSRKAIVSYLSKRLKILDSTFLRLGKEEFVRDTCYRKLTLEGGSLTQPLTFFLSPDQRFVSPMRALQSGLSNSRTLSVPIPGDSMNGLKLSPARQKRRFVWPISIFRLRSIHGQTMRLHYPLARVCSRQARSGSSTISFSRNRGA